MQADFWHQKWEQGDTKFHESETNPLLIRYFNKLELSKGDRVFLPLCGKSRDFSWLLDNGYRVAGAELSGLAIKQLFCDLGIVPTVSRVGKLDHFHAQDIDIFVGDIFELTAEMLGPVNAVYDRAALVALPPNMRDRYSAHLMQITNLAPQLLICFEYDQQLMDGPPFSIDHAEVTRHYEGGYEILLVETKALEGGFKGRFAAIETAWILQK